MISYNDLMLCISIMLNKNENEHDDESSETNDRKQ